MNYNKKSKIIEKLFLVVDAILIKEDFSQFINEAKKFKSVETSCFGNFNFVCENGEIFTVNVSCEDVFVKNINDNRYNLQIIYKKRHELVDFDRLEELVDKMHETIEEQNKC